MPPSTIAGLGQRIAKVPLAPEPSRRRDIFYGSGSRVAGLAVLTIGAGILLTRTTSAREQSKGERKDSHRQQWLASRPIRKRSRQGHEYPDDKTRRTLAGVARLLFGSSAVLSFSGAVDSGLEHYRGRYANPAMWFAPVISAIILLVSSGQALRPRAGSSASRAVYWLSAATGLSGLGFHTFNVGKRIGRFSLLNLFYSAPLLAPGTLFVAGVFGLLGDRVARYQRGEIEDPPSGRALGLGAAGAMLGTAAEAGLLHYRGAFQNPYMLLPVTLPPLTAAALATATFNRTPATRATARTLTGATAVLGLVGTAFHAYGIHRNMGGWKNWSQMILQGPPLAAPPGFTGIALAGLAALKLMEQNHE